MTLSAEQRRALALLANGNRSGVTQTLLGAHGFSAPMIAGLVIAGLATFTREQVKVGDKTIEVGRARIADAGRRALAAGG